jgi:glycosyltransferase involved in cell wall biosynthesis
MKSRKIVILVSNDLEFDQRVAKVCETLRGLNYAITLVGRKLPESRGFERPYEVVRFSLPFRKGALFYASLNIRLFFFLLFHPCDVILANDLDTLLPAYLVARIRGKQLVYDSHEYFTEAEGLTGRAFQKNVWLRIERFIFPKLKNVYTVNESIASIYRQLYKVDVRVVRNMPRKLLRPHVSRCSRQLPKDKTIFLLQGAYIDPDRGAAEAVEAMAFVDNALLLIIGSGRALDELKQIVSTKNLQDRVWFFGKMPASELRDYTACADFGLSLDKPLHENYRLSLPNKLFDYIHAGVPVLVSALPELERIIHSYNVGWIIDDITPEKVADAMNRAVSSSERAQFKANCLRAAEELNWEKEEEVLRSIYSALSRTALF